MLLSYGKCLIVARWPRTYIRDIGIRSDDPGAVNYTIVALPVAVRTLSLIWVGSPFKVHA
jgi:hypothetical protein